MEGSAIQSARHCSKSPFMDRRWNKFKYLTKQVFVSHGAHEARSRVLAAPCTHGIAIKHLDRWLHKDEIFSHE